MDCVFLLLVCLIIFVWMPDIINCTLLSDRYFGIHTNILGLCSGVKLSYLEILLFLEFYFYALLSQSRPVPYLRLIIPLLLEARSF